MSNKGGSLGKKVDLITSVTTGPLKVAVAIFLLVALLVLPLYGISNITQHHYQRHRQSDTYAVMTSYNDLKNRSRKPIPFQRFGEMIAKFHENHDYYFWEDFEEIADLSDQLNVTTHAAQKKENRDKNRYWSIGILAYDHSRVKLQLGVNDDVTSDYINANYISGFNSAREYIATQGPMNATIPHFWRMVWEQKSSVIVMLSDLMEGNWVKVAQYWPETLQQPVTHGGILIEQTNHSKLGKYVIRHFQLSVGEEKRDVTHFHLPGWTDFRANIKPEDVFELSRQMRRDPTPPVAGPIVVHCSAGIGRSGTFITLDYFRQFISKYGPDADLDVFGYVMSLRHQRNFMVETGTQYMFIFDALAELIQRQVAAYPPSTIKGR